jgi:hypothetical protein
MGSLTRMTVTWGLLVIIPPTSFGVIVDCHEGYMLILCLGDEIYGKLV